MSKPTIAPEAADFSKSAPADTTLTINWGSATKVTEVLAGAPAFGLKFDPKEGTHYTITDNGDGTATVLVKKETTSLLPVPLPNVPNGAQLVVTIKFDTGDEAKFTYTVVN